VLEGLARRADKVDRLASLGRDFCKLLEGVCRPLAVKARFDYLSEKDVKLEKKEKRLYNYPLTWDINHFSSKFYHH
jgi:hypothetical protein